MNLKTRFVVWRLRRFFAWMDHALGPPREGYILVLMAPGSRHSSASLIWAMPDLAAAERVKAAISDAMSSKP